MMRGAAAGFVRRGRGRSAAFLRPAFRPQFAGQLSAHASVAQLRWAAAAAFSTPEEFSLGTDPPVSLRVHEGRLQWVSPGREPFDVSQVVFVEDTATLSIPDTESSIALPVGKNTEDAPLTGDELAERDRLLSRLADYMEHTRGDWKVSLSFLPRGLYEMYHRQKEEALTVRRRELQLQHSGQSGSFEDFTEFLERHKSQLDAAKAKGEEDEVPNKGFIEYGQIIGGWFVKKGSRIRKWAGRSAEERAEAKKKRKEDQAANRSRADASMQHFYQAQELCNLMKFKAATFDDGRDPAKPAADFAGWSRTIVNNYNTLKRTTAFSNMAFHVVRDPSKLDGSVDASRTTNYREIDEGSLSGWMDEEGGESSEPKPQTPAPSQADQGEKKVRPPPFTVDYATGEVTILDTCSTEEFLDFLEREAPRAEARQLQIVEEQTKMFEDLGKALEKSGLKRVVFNSGSASVTDREYKDLQKEGREGEYILPVDIFRAIDALNGAPLLYRKFLKGQTLRLLPTKPCRSYFVDAEKGEVCMPKDFYRDSFLPIHRRYRIINSVTKFIWSLRYIATLIIVTLVGDVDWPAFGPLAG
eukprot:Hpha_TRINITY_DN35159_c0_g1::TRINITY_DN35159_c0_g1_i1::g.168386::m.168386